VTRIPIACTLTADDAEDRVGEWRSFFATHGRSSALRSPTELSVSLRPGDEALLAAADLAGREQSCCSFFTFAIAIDAEERRLEVRVPDEDAAVSTLADFASLAATPGGSPP